MYIDGDLACPYCHSIQVEYDEDRGGLWFCYDCDREWNEEEIINVL